ncbi:MAG: heme-binding protein [Coriobacteriales bacterium]|nr:heme-binding protein [Coriobacteriales bacterium]
MDELWANAPEVVPSAGAFPVRVGEEWVATLCVSGLHDGKDHEHAVRALEAELGVAAPALGIQIS